MNEIKNIKEFKSQVQGQGFIYCDLFTPEGKRLMTRNQLKPDYDKRLGEIIKKVQSPALVNQTYLIRCYVASSSEPEIFAYHKGGVNTLTKELPRVVTENKKESTQLSENVLSYSKALEYQNDINRLTFENQRLTEENIRLQEELDEYEEEETERENNPTLSQPSQMEQVKGIVENILATGLPALNRYFDLKEKSLELQLIKAGRTPIAKPKAVEPAPAQPTEEQQVLIDKINLFLDKVGQENEELYIKLEEMSSRVASLEQWLVQVKTNYPETFQELENFISQTSTQN